MNLNRRMPRIEPSQFAMVPRADIPRARFTTRKRHLSTFNAGQLVPILVKEVLPGDHHRGRMHAFARLSTTVFPLMDELEVESFFFFAPNRILWDNWTKLQGERINPSDSISYTTPQIVSPSGGFAPWSVYDHMGIPTAGQVAGGANISISALPLRAWNRIFNDWFRDENLQSSVDQFTGNGPDPQSSYACWLRNKPHDYFTSCLPWPLKGGVEVALPLGGQAPIRGLAIDNGSIATAGNPPASFETPDVLPVTWSAYWEISNASADKMYVRSAGSGTTQDTMIYADLGSATGATINALRLAVQTQRLLERDARGGTRYTEILRSHWGITPQDARLQRPEYIGGGRGYVQMQAIPQTSGTGASGTTSPLGALGAAATFSDMHPFEYHAQEHGWIIGLVNVRARPTYQQGLHRQWSRLTRYDYPMPVFAHLGEQAVLNKEIYMTGNFTQDNEVFGYQERYAELRYDPSTISGSFRSYYGANIDEWHLSEYFSALPLLNASFIGDKTQSTLLRALSAGANANEMQILWDSVFEFTSTRSIPMRSVPGNMDRF